MSSAAEESRFAPEAFFAAARRALSGGALAEGGDHLLNPHLVADDTALRDAAVLVPVVARHPEASVILTERTSHLSAHAGQIAFPGGKIDAGDRDAAAAALREAQEEIGLDPARVEIVGSFPPYLSRTGYRIVPVLGRVAPDYATLVNANEVADLFEVPLAFLMDPANHRRVGRTFAGQKRYFYEMPFGEHYIWGVTAGIIRALYEQVYG